MQKKLGAITLVLVLSLNSDGNSAVAPTIEDPPVCGICFELDNETLPDKHYFPTREELEAAGGVLPASFASGEIASISAQVWAWTSSVVAPRQVL